MVHSANWSQSATSEKGQNMVKVSFKDSFAARIIAGISRKTWAVCGAALLTCFIIFCFYGFLIALGIVVTIALCVCYQIQDSLLYHPDLPQHSRCYVAQPSIFSLPFEVVYIRSTDNVTLHAFWIRHPGEKSKFVPTIVYFHGNAGNIGHRLQNAKGFVMRCGVNVLIVDYRGYGLSTGTPSEQGLHDDARATFNHLLARNDLDHNQICLFGRSLGGAVAIDLAADTEYSRRIMCVIVENSFTSIQDMACHLLHPNFKYIPVCCYKNKFSSINKIEFFSAPCLLMSGLADVLVPPKMMMQLYTKCGSVQKEIHHIEGGTHNESWMLDGYYPAINEFLAACTEVRGPLLKPPSRSKDEWPKVEEV